MGMHMRRLQRDEGASAVEFALVALLLITLLTGLMQFGFFFMQYLEVVHAAREGARWASLAPPAGIGGVADDGSVKNRVQLAAPALQPPLEDDDIVVLVDGVERTDLIDDDDSGDTVGVTVTFQSTFVIPPMNLIIGDEGLTLESTAVHRVE
jgi:Flp pilus assembly protein TadG